MVLNHPVDRKQNASSSHYGAFQLKDVQSKQNANGFKLPERNARHYKSSLVLNCAPTNGSTHLGATSLSTATSSGSSPMAMKDGPAHGLPRLANALKSLISSTGINASFKSSKSAFIDAGDEVIYYSNVAAPTAGVAKSSHNNGGAAQQRKSDKGEMPNKAPRRSPSLNRIDKCGHNDCAIDENDDEEEGKQFSASSSSHYFAHRQPTTLEQIRQLYKSVPNFSSFGDCEEVENEENNAIEGQQPQLPTRKFEARIGRLCPANVGNENPPPLQTQKKRLEQMNVVQSTQRGGGMDGKVSAKSPLSCGTPSSSAASSLSSSNSSRSMPAVQANNNNVEQVAEQCEKMVKPTRQIKSNLSLACCSLDSNSSAGIGDKNASKIPEKKFSPTDSGYRSRGETPKGSAVGGLNLNSKGRPQSMIYPNTEFDYSNQREEEKAGNGQLFSQIYSPKRPHKEKEYMRKYIWTEKAICEEAINKWPFAESEFREWIDGNFEGISKLLFKTFSELAKKIWEELRRLTSALVKCTLRDIFTVVLLLFPPQIAWQCLSNAAKSVKYLEKSGNGNEATKMTISERARLQYFRAGQFIRWMLDTKVATIVDGKCATFLAAIFDSLLNQFIQLLKTEPKGREDWSIKLEDLGILKVLAGFKPFTKSIHILRPLPSDDQTSLPSFADILHNLPLTKLVFTGEFPNLEAEIFGKIKEGGQLAFGNSAVLALYFWLNCAEHCEKLNDLEDWAMKATIFAIHRCANLIEECDVLQAVRLILPNFDCPPPLADHFNLDAHFSASSKAIILARNTTWEEGVDGMIRKWRPNIWPEFTGWTPFCWAIALEKVELVEEMLQRRPAICREVRNHAEPLKICAETGNLEICELLLRYGANPFTKSSNSSISSMFSSPFAIAAARANVRMLEMFAKCSAGIRPNTSNKQMLLLIEENNENKKKNIGLHNEWNLFPKFGCDNILPENEKRAFSEAIWLGAETDQMEIVLLLKKTVAEIPWLNSGIWLQCLEWLIGKMDTENGENLEKDLMELLKDFGPKMGEELMNEPRGQQRTELLAKLLFKLLSPFLLTINSKQRIRTLAARHLSTQFQLVQKGSLCQIEREFSAYFPDYFAANDTANSSHSALHLPPQIDPKFVDCPDLSDIRFRFADGQIVFAHRIVLINASEQFRQILRSPSGVIEVPNASAEVFRLLLEFSYGNLAKCAVQIGKMQSEQQIHLIELARRFGLKKLLEIGQNALGTGLRSFDGFQRIYKMAKEFELLPLMEDCERFGLANLPELMALFGGGEGQEWEHLLAKMSDQFRMALRESRI